MSHHPDSSPTAALEPLLSYDGLIAFLGCGRRTAERMKAAKKLPAPDLMIGRRPRWKTETIRLWVDRGGQK